MEDILDKVRAFADQSHGDQLRRYSKERYIVHPVKVMQLCKEYTNDLSVLAAALLHDVLEDTSVPRGDIRLYLETIMKTEEVNRTLQFVEELTDLFTKNNYPHWNRKLRRCKEGERLSTASPEAQTIKYADLIDNCLDIAENDIDFAPVFLRESKELLKKINRGNPLLYIRAVNTVEDCIRKVEPSKI
jgi:(p)ppGpp synthase/HD superfamily hydrolase